MLVSKLCISGNPFGTTAEFHLRCLFLRGYLVREKSVTGVLHGQYGALEFLTEKVQEGHVVAHVLRISVEVEEDAVARGR